MIEMGVYQSMFPLAKNISFYALWITYLLDIKNAPPKKATACKSHTNLDGLWKVGLNYRVRICNCAQGYESEI